MLTWVAVYISGTFIIIESIASFAARSDTLAFNAITVSPTCDTVFAAKTLHTAVVNIVRETIAVRVVLVRFTLYDGNARSIFEFITISAFGCYTLSFRTVTVNPAGIIGKAIVTMTTAIIDCIFFTIASVEMFSVFAGKRFDTADTSVFF